MAGHEDAFFAVGADADVMSLIGDIRPAFVFDRSGTRLLWANAAGIASTGGDAPSLLARHFPSSSPLARRISVVAGQLVSGQTRTDRIPLPRGLVPAPVLCRVRRIAAGDYRGVLVIDAESRSPYPSEQAARTAYETMVLGLKPPLPLEAPEAPAVVSDPAAPAPLPGDLTPEATEFEPVTETPAEAAGAEALDPFVPVEAGDGSGEGFLPLADDAEQAFEAPFGHVQGLAGQPDATAPDFGPADEREDVLQEAVDDVSPELASDEPASVDPDVAEPDMAEPDVAEPADDADRAASSRHESSPWHIDGEEPASTEPSAPIEEPDAAILDADAPAPVEPEELPEAIEGTEAVGSDAAPSPTAFAFPQHGRSVRFVFELDSDLAFSFLSSELAETVGVATTPATGERWSALATRIGIDPVGRVGAALGRHDTFTGLTVDWPVEDHGLRVPVDLAGMPVFSRDRRFQGYRGFGIAKTGAAVPVDIETDPFFVQPAAVETDEAAAVPSAALAPEPLLSADAIPVDDAISDRDVPTDPSVTEEPPADLYDIGPLPALALDEGTFEEAEIADLGSEEAPALVEDIEPEVVVDPPLEDTAAEGLRSPDPETLSAAEAELYAQPEETDVEDHAPAVTDDELWPADDMPDDLSDDEPHLAEWREDAVSDEIPSTAKTDDAEALWGEQPEDDALESLADSDDGEVVAFDETAEPPAAEDPQPSVDDSEADGPDADVPEAADAELDVAWHARTGEVIPSPMIARPIPPQSELTPEEVARRQLSRPEREAFEKIAEALGARVEDSAVRDSAGEHDVIRVVSPQAKAPVESSPPIDSAVLDRLPVAMAILRNGDAVLVNRAFLDLTGYADLADLDSEGGFAEAFVGSPLARQGSLPAIRHRDGGIIPVEARLHSVGYGGGMASLIVVKPVQREMPAAAPLQTLGPASNTQDADIRTRELEAILDTATDGVLVIDDRGTIVGANRSAEALFGTETEAMIGAPFLDLLAPESHRAALDYLDGLARNGVASVLNDGREVIGRVQQGGLVPLFMTMGRVSAGRFCAVLRDITQWKRAEEELTTAKRAAENASSQKSDFLAKISHEIRTPLNAIIGFSEVMMEERFGPVGSERYKEYLRDIHQSGTLIMSLVNDLLDLSKIEAGKLDLSFEAVVLHDVIRDCVALMQPQANRERVIIRTSLSSSVPNVVADPRSLRQIVLNLLSNAIKFNSAGGQVIVSTIYEDSGEVIIRVRDTGPGMSAEDLERALEPFRQLHTARPVRGTGLGLPLTKALVEANRASFRMDSSVGQGTLVQITFPTTRVLAE